MKPSLPKGTRDFNPEQVNKRNYIIDTLKKVFTRFGYQPLETPAVENLSTLTGKYGEEGDQLLFKVLNNGDFLKSVDSAALLALDSRKVAPTISKRGLRYDLTVPFARFVVMNQSNLAFPFRRYQIQPVWRGDRPQKGRYQEFYQCDVDIVGSPSLINEVELVQIFDQGYADLGLEVTIKINNRKVLAGLAEIAGIPDQFSAMTVAIDKLDKIGIEGVRKEMIKRDIPEAAIATIESALQKTTLDQLKILLANSEIGGKGIEELEYVFSKAAQLELNNTLELDITLARGLNYYTGCILEVASNEVQIGSIGGGGRYDDLTSAFGLKDVTGVGVSFGIARIFDCLEELNRFPDSTNEGTKILFTFFDEQGFEMGFGLTTALRKAGVIAEVFPDVVKFKKQMKYANARQIPFVAIIGDNEIENQTVSLKNMETGEQETVPIANLVSKLIQG
ncbi:MAG: histidine--tRNA ligase [Bacteroidota bacterium]